jgi:beta-N-acetylhexosaminidase
MRAPRLVPLLVALALAGTGCGAPAGGGPSATAAETRPGTPVTPPATAGSPAAAPPATPSPPASPPGLPTAAELARAESLVAGMPDDELAGAVIVARYAGTAPPVDLVRRLHLGGVIVMGENVGDVRTLRERTRRLQRAAGRDYPLVVAVDQEGGLVARVGSPATEFPAAMSFGAADDPRLARRVAAASGEELRALGFTMVLAPVADVTAGPSDPTIGSRSISGRPRVVAEQVVALLAGYADAGLPAVVKHFPGHGSVTADSHETLPEQDASLATLRGRDWVPFAAAVTAGAPAIMVAHLDVRAVDPGVPASLSGAVVTGQLRDRLRFPGVVVTDAQDMAAITARYGSGRAAVQAVAAGADVVLMPLDVTAAHAALVAAVGDGTLPRERLRAAASRVVALMLHVAETGKQPAESVVGSHRRESLQLSRAAVTVVSGPCSGRLVGAAVRVVGGTSADRSRFVAAARAAGLRVGSGDMIRLIGYGGGPGSGDVVVALDTPYALGRSSARTAAVALYGRTPEAFRALAEVLTGERPALGQLPVRVRGAARTGC